MQRYFIEATGAVGANLPLDETTSHHWLNVMRAQVGDHAEFVDATEQLFIGELIDSADEGHIKLIEAKASHVELPIKVTIASGLPKADKAEWIVQKATEMGADAIVFFPGQWSVTKWAPAKVAKKVARLQKIANGAAEQSHRVHRPTVSYVESLTQLLQIPADKKLVAYEESAKEGEQATLVQTVDQLHADNQLLTIFGPEGGISPVEITKMTEAGVVQAGLGPRILRTETAPLYLLAAVSTLVELNQAGH